MTRRPWPSILLPILLGTPLCAQQDWPLLAPEAWRLDPKAVPSDILLTAEQIRLDRHRLDRVRRYRILPGAKPDALLDLSGPGVFQGRFYFPDGTSREFLTPAFWQEGAAPGTRRPRALPGDGFLDLRQVQPGLPLGLLEELGPDALAWFPLPALHRRIPLRQPQRIPQFVLLTRANSGFTWFQGEVESLIRGEATDGNAFLTELRSIPAGRASDEPILHWYDLPARLEATQARPERFWSLALETLQEVYRRKPSGGLLWSRKRKPFLEGLPPGPEAAAQELLARLDRTLTRLDVTAEDVADLKAHFQDLASPFHLGAMLDEKAATERGRFLLAHRLFEDAGLKPRLKFAVDPSVGELRLDVPSLFQITHVLLGIPRPDGTTRWFDPWARPDAGFAPPPALREVRGLVVDSGPWTRLGGKWDDGPEATLVR